MSSNENKNKLVDFIVKQWISNSSLIGEKILIVINNTEAYKITSNNCILIPEFESNHKEADSQMMLHVEHASRTYSSVVIHMPNTDIFMIALSKIMEFDCQLYLKTGTKSRKRTIDINAVAQCVNHNISKTDCNKDTFLKALLTFHCFTGCDSISSFDGKGKLKPLSLLSSNENYIYGFSQVGTSCTVTEDIVRILEKFFCEMYGKKVTDTNLSINEIRYNIYCHQNGGISFAMLPPCLNVLKQHIIRVNYQTLIWRKCLDNFMVLNQPWESGWYINEKKLDVKWMTCKPVPDEVVFVFVFLEVIF